MRTLCKTIILPALALATAVSLHAANVQGVGNVGTIANGPAGNSLNAGNSPNIVTGKWKADFEATVGPLKYTYDLKQDGEKVTGKATRASDTETNSTDLTEGKLTGANITFVEALKIGDQDISITYKGTVAGDEMKLSRTVGEFGSTDIVAKRGQPVSLTGKWEAEFDGAIGHLKYTYDLKADGDKVTGKATRNQDDQKTETDLKDGKLTGDEVTFVEPLKVQGQDQEITITYTGKISGDEIKFSRVAGTFATNEITAKRAKDAEKK